MRKIRGNMMKTIKRNTNAKIWKGLLGAVCAFFLFANFQIIGHAEEVGKITVDSAKVRSEADVTSSVVGSAARGSTVTIVNEVTDASGQLWYEVYINGNTKGYIRSDLMEKTGETASAGSETNNLAETPLDAQYATVTVATAKIRRGPSTNDGVVTSLSQGTQLVVTGQSNGSDGKLWFYVSFMGADGVEETGFVRSDLIERGEMVPVEEPQEVQPDTSQEAEQSSGQAGGVEYELVYTSNEDGENVWWLYHYDYENGQATRQKLEELLAAAHAQSLNNDSNAKMVSVQRIIIIALIALVIILAVVMTIMIFKLRDAYYEDYEDDEEDEEDEEDEDEDEEEEPVRRVPTQRGQTARFAFGSEGGRRRREEEPERRRSTSQDRNAFRRRSVGKEDDMPDREVSYEEDDYVRPARKPGKKAKNFLVDDDDFEFEFLNIPDKDR